MTLAATEHLSGGYVRDPDERLIVVWGAVGGTGSSTAGVPAGATPVTSSSVNQANVNAVATLAAAAGKFTYISGFQCTASGSTAGLAVNVTIVGVLGGTMNYAFVFPVGVLVAALPLIVEFPKPVPSSAVNTAIVVTLPASGAGGTNATAVAQGFQL